MDKIIRINGSDLTIADVVAVARHHAKVELDPDQIETIRISRQFVEDAIASGQAIYGINTGFGKFANVPISPEELDLLQKNLIFSDACGVGDPFATEIVRAMMVLRLNSICKGNSGVLPATIDCLINMLNAGVHPIVRSKGSVALRDLCPGAHGAAHAGRRGGGVPGSGHGG